MCPLQPDLPDSFLHRVIDDLTAVRALANLARHAVSDGGAVTALAHLAHLDLVVMESATRIQGYRMQHGTAPPPSGEHIRVPPVCAA